MSRVRCSVCLSWAHPCEPCVRTAERINATPPEPAAPCDAACTCGSGGHPRECTVHPEAYAAHVAELQAEYDAQDAPEPDEAERAAQAWLYPFDEYEPGVRDALAFSLATLLRAAEARGRERGIRAMHPNALRYEWCELRGKR